MPKKGESLPWKVCFQYPGQRAGASVKRSLPAAVTQMLELRGQGATATVALRDSQGGLAGLSDAELIRQLREYQPAVMADGLAEALEARDWEAATRGEDRPHHE